MLIIGLTGGIGSGKTTVAKRFIELGTSIIDADRLAHELVMPLQPALQEIVAIFGTNILAADGSLNRGSLRQLVFADPTARKQLEAILHPRIRTATQTKLQLLKSSVPYVILAVPLLLETQQQDLCHRVLVVDIPESLQIERVQKRNDHSIDIINAIMAAQCSRSQRLAAADDIIDNSKDIGYLHKQIDELHHRYLFLSSK